MSGFIYGAGSGVAGYWMSMNLAKSSDASAKLASGMRISGKGGGGDIATYYSNKATAATSEDTARGYAESAAKAFGDAQRIDAAALLIYRSTETGVVGTDEATKLTAAAKTLLDAAKASTDELSAVAYTTAGVEKSIGEIAGIAAGLEAQAIAEGAAAALQREGNDNMIAVDFGSESATVTRNQILQQAAAAMVAQANQSQSAILALFK